MSKGQHSAILSTFIKLQFVFRTFVLSIFEWSLKTGFNVVVFSKLLGFKAYKMISKQILKYTFFSIGKMALMIFD